MPGDIARLVSRPPALPGNHPVNDLARTSDPKACAIIAAFAETTGRRAATFPLDNSKKF
jgi:hypothetical protein